MSAEQIAEDPDKKGSLPANARKFPVRQYTQEEIEARIIKRAEEVREKVARLEESQKVTQETMNLEFTI